MNGAVAQRYAQALADVAFERNIAEGVKGDLAAFSEAFFSSADLRNVLESPSVGRDLKQKVVEAVAAKMNLDTSVRNFIHLIVDHRRTEALREIEEAFRGADQARTPLSLYMHLPFCESLCLFCACNVVIEKDHAAAPPYLDLL